MLAVVLMGCEGSRPLSWLIDRHPARSPHEPVDTPAPDTEPTSISGSAPPSSSSPGGVHVIHLAFGVLRVDLPVEGLRHSRKVWNHVDELRLDSQAVALLAQNGLRIGVASPAAWPAIQTIIEAGAGTLHNEQLLTQSGLPVSVTVASIDEPETFFSYSRNSRLVGKTFPAGDKILKMGYAFHPELGGCTDLQISLEVQHDRGELTWERTEGVIRQVPAYDRHVFSDLSVLFTLNPGEAIVIGPSDEADNEYLVGSRFFTHKRAGQPYETLLCITPQPYRTKAGGRGIP
jgi:hypothetical protein